MAQITANGVRLEYDVSGPEDGAPLLLIMGFGTQMTGWPGEFRTMLTGAGSRVIPELQEKMVPFISRVEEIREDGLAIPVQPGCCGVNPQ